MSDTTDPELCSLITYVCKPPKNFGSPEIEQPFRFVLFEEFRWICYSRWEDRTYCLPCILFGHENVGRSVQKTISKMANSSKNIQNTSKCSNGNTQKETNIFSLIFRWKHIVSNLPLLLKGGNDNFKKSSKKGRGGGQFFKKSSEQNFFDEFSWFKLELSINYFCWTW